MNQPNMAEILIVNGIGIFLLICLLSTRRNDPEHHYPWEKLFTALIHLALAGSIAEVLSFLVDGKIFPGCIPLSFFLNAVCFMTTGTVGYLWCLFADLRIFGSIPRTRRRAVFLSPPVIFQLILSVVNLFGNGVLFTISDQNVYQRGTLVTLPYVFLFFYFFYSISLSNLSRKNGLHLHSLSALLFVVPCMLGTLVQGLFYGITLGWTSVAVAFVNVYLQTQFLNFYTDSLSMLYNRRYLDRVLHQIVRNSVTHVYGIMLDVNDFKYINDAFGHAAGDRAIRHISEILSRSIPSSGLAIRYAGDEFIILLRVEEPASVPAMVHKLQQTVDEWNSSNAEPYTLSFAVGCSQFDLNSMTADEFLTEMDRSMYDNKHQYYRTHQRRGERKSNKSTQ